MAGRNPQTQAKRARELALKEKRDRKKAKKAERALRPDADDSADDSESHPVDEELGEPE